MGSDTVDISRPGDLLSKLEKLKSDNPDQFQDVVSGLADSVSQLAQEQEGTPQGAMLSHVAERLRSGAETGDTSQLKPPAPPAGGFPNVANAYGQNDALQSFLKSLDQATSGDDGASALAQLVATLGQRAASTV